MNEFGPGFNYTLGITTVAGVRSRIAEGTANKEWDAAETVRRERLASLISRKIDTAQSQAPIGGMDATFELFPNPALRESIKNELSQRPPGATYADITRLDLTRTRVVDAGTGVVDVSARSALTKLFISR